MLADTRVFATQFGHKATPALSQEQQSGLLSQLTDLMTRHFHGFGEITWITDGTTRRVIGAKFVSRHKRIPGSVSVTAADNGVFITGSGNSRKYSSWENLGLNLSRALIKWQDYIDGNRRI